MHLLCLDHIGASVLCRRTQCSLLVTLLWFSLPPNRYKKVGFNPSETAWMEWIQVKACMLPKASWTLENERQQTYQWRGGLLFIRQIKSFSAPNKYQRWRGKPDKREWPRHQKEQKWIKLDRGQDKAWGDEIKLGKTLGVDDTGACWWATST